MRIPGGSGVGFETVEKLRNTQQDRHLSGKDVLSLPESPRTMKIGYE